MKRTIKLRLTESKHKTRYVLRGTVAGLPGDPSELSEGSDIKRAK